MTDIKVMWQQTRDVYLPRLKAFITNRNRLAFDHFRFLPEWTTAVYARMLRAVEPPLPKEMVNLICDTFDVLDYDIEQIETLDDGTVMLWKRGDIKLFILWFATSIRRCHQVFGDDFVRYVHRFNLADCYREQGEFESDRDYDTAFVQGWLRFIELADSYEEHYAAGLVMQRLERQVGI